MTLRVMRLIVELQFTDLSNTSTIEHAHIYIVYE